MYKPGYTVCDNCGTGRTEEGARSVWLKLCGGQDYDFCSRSCVAIFCSTKKFLPSHQRGIYLKAIAPLERKLSDREWQVLKMIRDGVTDKQINAMAQWLELSETRIKQLVAGITRKFGLEQELPIRLKDLQPDNHEQDQQENGVRITPVRP